MKPVRSLLFVPGHKKNWIYKALNSEADAIIIDLEDSVPESAKQVARDNAAELLQETDKQPKVVLVRPNALDTVHFGRDIGATTHSGLTAFLLPKLSGRDDVVRFDAIVSAAEHANQVRPGSIELMPSLETARSVSLVEDILTGPRVGGVMAAAAKDADISREVGFSWTPGGVETLYLRSRVVVAARAADIRCIVLGLWQDVRDLDGLRNFAADNHALGYTGQVIIHPSHASIANEEHGLSDQEIVYYQGLIRCFEEAVAVGDGAVSYDGEHIDLAHAQHARQLLDVFGVPHYPAAIEKGV